MMNLAAERLPEGGYEYSLVVLGVYCGGGAHIEAPIPACREGGEELRRGDSLQPRDLFLARRMPREINRLACEARHYGFEVGVFHQQARAQVAAREVELRGGHARVEHWSTVDSTAARHSSARSG